MAQQVATTRRAVRGARQRMPAWRLLAANFYDLYYLLRDSYWALLLFALIVAAGTAYLARTAAMSPPAALYETLRLLVFQSGLPFPKDALGAVLFFAIPLLGLLLIAQSVANFGRRLLDKGSRREAWQVSLAWTFRRHVAVCGLGRVGLRVATRLIEAGYEVVVIERNWNTEHVPRALALGIPVIVGDAREAGILRQANAHRADAVLALVNDDLVNIETALAVRALDPRIRVVLRAFNDEIDAQLEGMFGDESTFSASALAAPTVAAAALSRGIEYVMPLGESGQQWAVTTLALRPEMAAARTAGKFEETYGVRLLALGDGPRQSHPWAPRAALRAMERATLVGPLDRVRALTGMVNGTAAGGAAGEAEARPMVLVCGLGKVGYRVVRQLARQTPQPRIVVLHLPSRGAHGANDSYVGRIRGIRDVEIREGDARDPQALLDAGLRHASAVAAVTSDDFANLQIGLAARKERPDVHVVLRVFSDALAERLSGMFGIHTTYSTSDLASPTLAAAAVLPGAQYAFYAGDALFSTRELTLAAKGPLTGRTVEEARAREDILVVELRRDGRAWTPAPEERLAAGDRVTALAPLKTLKTRLG